MNADVFIGYAREDIEVARRIEEYIEAAGVRCYRDETGIPLTASWMEQVTNAIDACHAYLALVSDESVRSDAVHREIAIGVEARKTFVPLFLSRDVDPSQKMRFAFADQHRIYAVPSLEAMLPSLTDAVVRIVDRSKHKQAYDDEADVLKRANYHLQTAFDDDRAGLLS